MGARPSLLRLVPDAAGGAGGRTLLPATRTRGRSRLHHQDHDRAGELARRHGRRDDQPGHRPHRAQAPGTRRARFHQELHDARPDHGFRQPQGRHAGPRDQGALGPGAQQDRRYQGRPAGERAGSVLQRPVRRRVRHHLRPDGRWPLVPPTPRLCRGSEGADPENPRRRPGRAAGRAGRGRASQLLDPAHRRAGRRPAGDPAEPAGAECGGAFRHRAGRPRDGQPQGQRPVHLRGESSRRQSPGQRPLLPAGRRRHHHPRLRRPAAAHVPLQRPARDRHRHRHEAQRQHRAVRRGAADPHAADRG